MASTTVKDDILAPYEGRTETTTHWRIKHDLDEVRDCVPDALSKVFINEIVVLITTFCCPLSDVEMYVWLNWICNTVYAFAPSEKLNYIRSCYESGNHIVFNQKMNVYVSALRCVSLKTRKSVIGYMDHASSLVFEYCPDISAFPLMRYTTAIFPPKYLENRFRTPTLNCIAFRNPLKCIEFTTCATSDKRFILFKKREDTIIDYFDFELQIAMVEKKRNGNYVLWFKRGHMQQFEYYAKYLEDCSAEIHITGTFPELFVKFYRDQGVTIIEDNVAYYDQILLVEAISLGECFCLKKVVKEIQGLEELF